MTPRGIQTIIQSALKVGRLYMSQKTGLTAAGTSQTNGLQLTKSVNRIDTVGASSGVLLPQLDPERVVIVHNFSATTLKIYTNEATGVTLDGAGSNTAGATGISLAAHTLMTFVSSPTAWLYK